MHVVTVGMRGNALIQLERVKRSTPLHALATLATKRKRSHRLAARRITTPPHSQPQHDHERNRPRSEMYTHTDIRRHILSVIAIVMALPFSPHHSYRRSFVLVWTAERNPHSTQPASATIALYVERGSGSYPSRSAKGSFFCEPRTPLPFPAPTPPFIGAPPLPTTPAAFLATMGASPGTDPP